MNAIQYLLSIETKGIKLGFQRTEQMLMACGNPHLNLPAIQVSGTNGKGSVCSILAKILQSANYKTGLFTSPHLINLNERIRLNGVPIPNTEIDSFIIKYKQEIEKIGATFFETITTIAFWYFNKVGVDIAIMETGLGGRLDSVSICHPILTIITPISYDHMHILGEKLVDIAFEKSGSMKKDVLCISANQNDDVKSILLVESKKKGAPLHFVDEKKIIPCNINISGIVQKMNAQLAICALEYLQDYYIPQSAIEKGLDTVQWFGRNQLIQTNPLVIFDVAHNDQGLKYFINHYKSLSILGSSILVIAIEKYKRIQSIIPLFESIFKLIICTETCGNNPMRAKILQNHFSNLHNTKIIRDPKSAIKFGLRLLNPKDGIAIVGSHYLGPAVSKVFKIYFDKL